jgi:hypothetical protein
LKDVQKEQMRVGEGIKAVTDSPLLSAYNAFVGVAAATSAPARALGVQDMGIGEKDILEIAEQGMDPASARGALSTKIAERIEGRADDFLGVNAAKRVAENEDANPAARVAARTYQTFVGGATDSIGIAADIPGDVLMTVDKDASASQRVGAVANVVLKGLATLALGSGLSQAGRIAGQGGVKNLVKGAARAVYELSPVQGPNTPDALKSDFEWVQEFARAKTLDKAAIDEIVTESEKTWSDADKARVRDLAKKYADAAMDGGADISTRDALSAAKLVVFTERTMGVNSLDSLDVRGVNRGGRASRTKVQEPAPEMLDTGVSVKNVRKRVEAKADRAAEQERNASMGPDGLIRTTPGSGVPSSPRRSSPRVAKKEMPAKATEPTGKPWGERVLYRGENTTGKPRGESLGEGVYLTEHKPLAESYGAQGAVSEYKVRPDAKILESDSPEYNEIFRLAWDSKENSVDRKRLAAIAKERGYQGIAEVDSKGNAAQVVVFDSALLKKSPEPVGKPTKFKPKEDKRYGTSDLPQLDLVGMAKANEPKQPAKPVTPKVETGTETPIKRGSFPHHIAMYNGKAVLIDYVGKKDRDQFVTGASRIATNGAEGYVITTKGEVFKVTQKSRRASPVTGAEREQVLAELKSLEPKSPKPDQVPDAGKMVEDAPVAKPGKPAKKEIKEKVDDYDDDYVRPPKGVPSNARVVKSAGQKQVWQESYGGTRTYYLFDGTKSRRLGSVSDYDKSSYKEDALITDSFEPWELSWDEIRRNRGPQLRTVVSKTGRRMTRNEWVSAMLPDQTFKFNSGAPTLEAGGSAHTSDVVVAKMREAHKASVEKALEEGKPVPKEVLADYPDLAKKYGAAKDAPVATPAKDTASGKKEPWEMTREEWRNLRSEASRAESNALKMVDRGGAFPGSPRHNSWLWGTPERIRLEFGVEAQPIRKNGVPIITHERVIEKALKDGKPVPAEVLADYPDLAKKYGTAKDAPAVPAVTKPEAPKTASPVAKPETGKIEASVVAPEKADSAVIRKAHNIPPAKNRIPMPEEWKSEKMIPGMGLRPSQRDFLVKELTDAKARGDKIAEVKVPGDGEWKIKTDSSGFNDLLTDLKKKRLQTDSGPVKLGGGGLTSANVLYKMVKASDKVAAASGQTMPRIKFLAEVGEAQLKKEGWTVSSRYSSREGAKADVKEGGWIESMWRSDGRRGGTIDYYAINPPKELVESQAKNARANQGPAPKALIDTGLPVSTKEWDDAVEKFNRAKKDKAEKELAQKALQEHVNFDQIVAALSIPERKRTPLQEVVANQLRASTEAIVKGKPGYNKSSTFRVTLGDNAWWTDGNVMLKGELEGEVARVHSNGNGDKVVDDAGNRLSVQMVGSLKDRSIGGKESYQQDATVWHVIKDEVGDHFAIDRKHTALIEKTFGKSIQWTKGRTNSVFAEKDGQLVAVAVSRPVKQFPIVSAKDTPLNQLAPKQTNKGTYVWDAKQKRGLITLFENADISTILHETAHHQLRYMPKDMYRVIAQGAGVDPNTDMDKLKRADYVRVQEFYARGVEETLYQQSVNPNPKIQAAFNHAAKRIRTIYGEAGVPLPEGGRGRGRGLNQSNPQTKTPAFKKWFGDSKVVDEKGEPLVVYHGTDDPGFEEFGRQTTADGYFFAPDPETANFYVSDNYSGGVYPVYLKIEKLADFDDPEIFDEVAREAIWDTSRDDKAVRTFAERLYKDGYHKNPTVKQFFDSLDGIEDVGNDGWTIRDVLDENWVSYAEIDKLVDDLGMERLTAEYNRMAPVEEIQYATEAYGGQEFYRSYQDDFMQAARSLGYDGVVFTDPSPVGESTSYVVFDPTQIKSAIANKGTFDPNDPSILNQGPGKGGGKPDYSAVYEVFAQMLGGTVKPLREAPMDSMPVKTGAKVPVEAPEGMRQVGTMSHAQAELIADTIGLDKYEKIVRKDADMMETANSLKSSKAEIVAKALGGDSLKDSEQVALWNEVHTAGVARKAILDKYKNGGAMSEADDKAFNALTSQVQENLTALNMAGSEAGRALRARSLALGSDLSEMGVMAKFVAATGELPNARVQGQIAELTARIAELTKQVETKKRAAKKSVDDAVAFLKSRTLNQLKPDEMTAAKVIARSLHDQNMSIGESVGKMIQMVDGKISREDALLAFRRMLGEKKAMNTRKRRPVGGEVVPLDEMAGLRADRVLLLRAQKELADLMQEELAKLRWETAGGIQKTGIALQEFKDSLVSLVSSSDISGARQAFYGIIQNPKAGAKAFMAQIKALRKEGYEEIMTTLQASDEWFDAMDHGLDLPGKPNFKEELFRGNTIRKVPGVGAVVNASDQAYEIMVTSVRYEVYKMLEKRAKTDAERRLIASFANIMTGRTGTGVGKRHANSELSKLLFWAPQYMFSRFEMAALPLKILKAQASPKIKAELLSRWAGQYAVLVAGMGAIAAGTGGTFVTDPADGDFGKVVWPSGAELDAWAGFRPVIRLGLDMLQPKRKAENVYDREADRFSRVTDFGIGKLNPALNATHSFTERKDTIGQGFGVKDFLKSFLPLGVSQTGDAFVNGLSMTEVLGVIGNMTGAFDLKIDQKNKMAKERDLAKAYAEMSWPEFARVSANPQLNVDEVIARGRGLETIRKAVDKIVKIQGGTKEAAMRKIRDRAKQGYGDEVSAADALLKEMRRKPSKSTKPPRPKLKISVQDWATQQGGR